jgi:hypothetical protein
VKQLTAEMAFLKDSRFKPCISIVPEETGKHLLVFFFFFLSPLTFLKPLDGSNSTSSTGSSNFLVVPEFFTIPGARPRSASFDVNRQAKLPTSQANLPTSQPAPTSNQFNIEFFKSLKKLLQDRELVHVKELAEATLRY